ncbi:MAG TPA: hydroxymethylbilane synthase [Flavobacteriia bacterium]|nr:hydroxymethylbilane synthase [Flavobacteriia bacterium]
MKNHYKIGTRKSELALKQAHSVGELIQSKGGTYEIIKINSEGDLDLKTPLHQIGYTGVFTKALDIALMENMIDIAVHSLKDVPTILPEKIKQIAVLKRDNPLDILLLKNAEINFDQELTIATGSIRRKAQWLYKYPNHKIVGLRGNVNTRIQKLQENSWNGAIFSHSGLDRINLIPKNHIQLDWMISAPAQGIISIVALKKNKEMENFMQQFNHKETEIASSIERDFLNELEGGCSAPIGALAKIKNNMVYFTGSLTSPNGENHLEIKREISLDKITNFGRVCAQEILKNGGKEIMLNIKNNAQN